MKATIDVPDDLYRRVKAKSAMEGRTVRAVVVELLADWLEGNQTGSRPASERSQETKSRRPDWFSSLRKYARPSLSHDMASIRQSIGRGLEANRPPSRGRP